MKWVLALPVWRRQHEGHTCCTAYTVTALWVVAQSPSPRPVSNQEIWQHRPIVHEWLVCPTRWGGPQHHSDIPPAQACMEVSLRMFFGSVQTLGYSNKVYVAPSDWLAQCGISYVEISSWCVTGAIPQVNMSSESRVARANCLM